MFFDGNGKQVSLELSDMTLLHNYTKWNGKHVAADGNSLVQSWNWLEHLADFLGMSYTNNGLAGSMIVAPTSTMDDIKTDIANNYPDNLDLVILQGDTNGAMDGAPSDQMDGENPLNTWTARMNYFIRCLKAKYHNIVIVLMPDSVRYDGGVEQYTVEKNRTSYTAMKALAEYNRLAFFDFDHSTPFNPLHDDNWYARYQHEASYGISQDMVHPYTTYAVAKGKALAHFLAGLVFDPDAPNTAVADWQGTV